MMKRFFTGALMCVLALGASQLTTSCDPKEGGEGEQEQITLPKQDEKNQTAFADDESTGSFTFVAKSTWTATAEETDTRAAGASGVVWLSLFINGEETYSGSAGTFTYTIQLDPNYTGETRTATITITCNGSKLTITVTQQGTTEAGVVPVDPGTPNADYFGAWVIRSAELDKYWESVAISQDRLVYKSTDGDVYTLENLLWTAVKLTDNSDMTEDEANETGYPAGYKITGTLVANPGNRNIAKAEGTGFAAVGDKAADWWYIKIADKGALLRAMWAEPLPDKYYSSMSGPYVKHTGEAPKAEPVDPDADYFGVWKKDNGVLTATFSENELTVVENANNTTASYTLSDIVWTVSVNHHDSRVDYPTGYKLTGTVSNMIGDNKNIGPLKADGSGEWAGNGDRAVIWFFMHNAGRQLMWTLHPSNYFAYAFVKQPAVIGGSDKRVAKMVVTTNDPDDLSATVNYTYDNEKRVSKIESSGFEEGLEYTVNYTYSPDKVMINYTYSNAEGRGTGTDEMTLNTSGYVISNRSKINFTSNESSEYDEVEEELINMEYLNDRIYKTTGSEDVTPTTCTWDANGNMTKMELFNNSGEVMESYTAEYTDYPNTMNMDMNFDMWPYMGGFLGGAHSGDFNGKRGANLLSKVAYYSSGAAYSYHLTYQYEFDDEGLLVKIVVTDSGDGSIETYAITYE